jgi:glucose/arabinose dehydrogenase
MRGRRVLCGLVGAAMVAASVGATLGVAVHDAPPAAADTFTDPGFVAETVATVPPFTLVGLTFAADGRMFVWQKNGVVRIIKNGVLLPTPFIDVSSHVNTFDDRGFWGLALDPDYATNGFVYLSYTYEEAGDPNDQGPKTARLTRVTSNPANRDVALAGETVIMGSIGDPPCSSHPAGADCIAADGGSHSLGELQFLQDGTLLVGMGDGADAGPTDPLPLRAQDLNSTNGKILRINKDGTAPPDNPYYNGTNSVRSKVWLYGVRNPFRFDVQPGTGDIWFGDVGWNTWEEVNHGTRGSNHGWPCWEGNEVNDTYRTTATCAALQQSAVTMPYETYNHSTGATAVIGGPFYNATAYPQRYRGNYFYADYTGNFIKRVVFDAAHNPVGIQTFATNVEAPVSLAVGPDGFIYYLSFTTGQIRRIRPSGPAAAATATPRYGMSPLTVSFSSAGTTNPAGGALTYNWIFGDGTTSTQANPTHTYTVSGVQTFTATLRVTDSAGVSSTATVDVTVNSTPPVPTITQPLDGTQVEPGQTVTYQGSASDPEEGPLPPSALSWTILLHHNTHIHTFVGGSGSSGSFVAENHGSIGTYSYEIVLTATDSSGLSTSRSINLPVIGDTTPPSAPSALTATANGAGRIDLAWQAATDDNSVAGYQVERCQGATCTNFVQLSQAPTGTSMTDTGLLPSTIYRYRVRAADAMGNVGAYSDIAAATTVDAPPAPAGLVAGYTFDAGSGLTLADVSGNGNNGTISGGTSWTTGKYGGALSFNGSTGRVSVPSSPSLGLSSAMTLMAWIQPTASQSGWRTIMQRQSDAYFLNASNDSGPLRPSGGGTFGGDTSWVTGTTASPVNAWTHVALTYDGATLRLYVNGTQVATGAASGAIQSSTNPLWIGGNNPYGEYFQGLIDEARVYNRALSATDIQAAMNTPLN